MRFAQASRVEQIAEGTWRAEIRPGWDIAGNTNGGYMLAIVGRAMAGAVGEGQPIAISAHYLSPGRPGPVDIDVRVLKRGRSFTTALATLRAGERPVMQVTATFGRYNAAAQTHFMLGGPPDLPAPEECVEMVPGQSFPPPLMGQIEERLHPEDTGYMRGAPSGYPRVRGWFRLRDGEVHDPMTSLLAIDAFPPPAFNGHLPPGWTPTLQLSGHFRAAPGAGWLRCVHQTRFATGGFVEADGEIWSQDGSTLIAQSRQLALVLQV